MVVDIYLFPYLGNHQLIKLAYVDTYKVVLAFYWFDSYNNSLGSVAGIIYDEIKDWKGHKTYLKSPK